jgi:flagellar basal-body rod protein FlgB
MSILFDPTNGLLADMIRATAVRHRVLAANLANVETPGYQAQEATFSTALAEAQGRGPAGADAAARVAVTVAPDPDAPARRDGNNVDLDRQMVKLAQNTTWHAGLIQILTNRMGTLKTAMRDRI